MVAASFVLPALADTPTVAEREKARKARIKSYDSKPGEIYFGIDNSSFNNPYYKKEVIKALQKRSGNFDFGRMRDYYTQTSQYDPYADKIQEKLYMISYIVAQNKDPDAVAQAFTDFSEIIKAHMPNINVITLAISMAKEDKRYGDPKFYQWISQGIMHTVTRSGDGSSFSAAYSVLCTDEEDLLLRHLKVAALKSELIPYGSRYYNLHEVKDLRTGAVRELFVDVTIPLAKAESVKSKSRKKFNLRR